MPPIALVTRPLAAQSLAAAAALLFAAFVAGGGMPTLRHDWNWPIDRGAIPSFFSAAVNGWVSGGLGAPNPHPTTYLIGLPLTAVMWAAGPLAALALLAAVTGYAVMRSVAAACAHYSAALPAALGVGLFALFNPWVYNEVVAGHLVMVLAYGGLIGLFAEMLRGENASPVRLALWAALIEAQLQFYILAMLALAAFALATRKWLPLVAGALVGLPSIVGLIAERASLERIPYGLAWQANQSVWPLPLLGLGGYFAGYSDRLGLTAPFAVWLVLGLAVVGAIAAHRSRAAVWALAVAAATYVAVLGVHGPFAAAYAWVVRSVPESGVFRELYDLAGVIAALLALLACAAAARLPALRYVALAAGVALPAAWAVRPPAGLWVAANAYPHPQVAAPPFTRVALMPAFQPLALRSGRGDGADPDAYGRPGGVSALNEYFPTYPVDMALAVYEQSGDARALRALGVSEIVARPWLVSKTRGAVGLAAQSLAPRSMRPPVRTNRYLAGATPLIGACGALRIVGVRQRLRGCGVFAGDAPHATPVRAIAPPGDSIDARTGWIDARLAFAQAPALAQAMGGALTQSTLPMRVDRNAWLLAYVKGTLSSAQGRRLAYGRGSFLWLHVPADVASVVCAGLCELIAQAPHRPEVAQTASPPRVRALQFARFAPWLYVVSANGARGLLRFNERYDSGWTAWAARPLQHVRVDMSVNGWLLDGRDGRIVLVHVTAAAQLIAEIVGALCVIWLLKALARAPTKRAR